MDRSHIAKPHPDTAESYHLLWYFAAVFLISALSAFAWRPSPAVIGAATAVIGVVTAGAYATALCLGGTRQRIAAYVYQCGMVLFAVASASFVATVAGGLAAAATSVGLGIVLWVAMRMLPVRRRDA